MTVSLRSSARLDLYGIGSVNLTTVINKTAIRLSVGNGWRVMHLLRLSCSARSGQQQTADGPSIPSRLGTKKLIPPVRL